jgi:GT2 family glycosyltransferase
MVDAIETNGTPRLSIVVATRRRHAGLRRLLDSLFESEPSHLASVELVVVEDGPPFVGELKWPGRVTRIRHDARRGLARSRNEGIVASSAPLVAFLDDDGVCSSGWIDAVLEVFADRSIEIVGGVVVASDLGENLFSALRQRIYYLETFGATYGPSGDRDPSGETERAPYASGGVSVYRREVFDRYGLFDTDLPASIDTEWGARLAVEDRPALCRSLILFHDHPSTARGYYRRCFTAGMTRGRLARKRVHRGNPALDARLVALEALERLVWRNLGRSRRLTGQSQAKAWLALQVQALVFLSGILAGLLTSPGGESVDGH